MVPGSEASISRSKPGMYVYQYGATTTVTGPGTSNPGARTRNTNSHDASSVDASKRGGSHSSDDSSPSALERSG